MTLKSLPILVCLLPLVSVADMDRPDRIVSINQCIDELLLNLADAEQVQSVSHYVKDPMASWDAPLALRIPGNRGAIEEIIKYNPDLVLVGEFNARSTVSMLRGLGVRVVEIPHPKRLSEAIEIIHQVADVVGHPQRAEALTSKLTFADDNFPGQPVSAVVYQPNGFTTGKNSVIDDVMRAAGLENIARDWGTGEYSYFPMERLLWRVPDLLILDPQTHDAPSLAHQVLKHPALAKGFGEVRTVSIPPQAWACGSHHLAQAVRLLREAATPLRGSSRAIER